MKSITYIAIVGLPGSGKSEASALLYANGFETLRFGDQTDVGLREQGLPLTEENERIYRETIRKELGMAAMAIKIKPRIKEAQKRSDRIVLDGMRSWEEYLYLKDAFPGLIVLSIYASPRVRYKRLASRKVRPLSHIESQTRDRAEIEHLNCGGPIAMADYVIINEGTKEDLSRSIQTFLKGL